MVQALALKMRCLRDRERSVMEGLARPRQKPRNANQGWCGHRGPRRVGSVGAGRIAAVTASGPSLEGLIRNAVTKVKSFEPSARQGHLMIADLERLGTDRRN